MIQNGGVSQTLSVLVEKNDTHAQDCNSYDVLNGSETCKHIMMILKTKQNILTIIIVSEYTMAPLNKGHIGTIQYIVSSFVERLIVLFRSQAVYTV